MYYQLLFYVLYKNRNIKDKDYRYVFVISDRPLLIHIQDALNKVDWIGVVIDGKAKW